MGQRRLFEYDPHRGLRIDWEDTGDGKFALHYTQDVEPLLESNRDKRLEGREYYARDNELWKVASIPIVVQYEWLKRYGVDVYNPDHMKKVQTLLNDPEWRYLKTAEVII